ncbi:hypothetical protein ACF0H5_017209 [Mactra antiquata]
MLGQVLWILLALESTLAANIHLYVSPTGDDNNNGTSDKLPVRTIQKALNLVYQSQYANYTPYIELMKGYHDLSSTLGIYRHDLTMRSYNHAEVHVTGGKRIPSASFKPVTDAGDLAKLPPAARQHVKWVSLPSVNISNYGKLHNFGTFSQPNAALEISYNGIALVLPSWPKKGYLDITSVPDPKGLTFHYNATETKSWHTEAEPWIYGYLQYTWSDKHVQVTSLDTRTQTVTIKDHVVGQIKAGQWIGTGRHSVANAGYFKFENILSALSEPGEYYVDREHGKLFLWPPTRDNNIHNNDVIYASIIDNCIYMDKRSTNVKLQDFTLESCRHYGIGAGTVDGLQLTNLEIKNTGIDGIVFFRSVTNSRVSECYIHDTTGGMIIRGGNRTILESSGNIIENNEITRFDRKGAVGYAGIIAEGVGHLIRNNHIYNTTGDAMSYNGNDIIMEYNLIHDCGIERYYSDVVYSGHDLTARGNIIRHNIIHDNVGMPYGEVHGIQLDDHSSGSLITNNVFYNNNNHIKITGGRNNIVTGNLMYNAKVTSFRLDIRTKLSDPNNRSLNALPYTDDLWRLRYPKLANLGTHNATLPEGNQIVKNIVHNEDNGATFFSGQGVDAHNPYFYNISELGVSTGPNNHFDIKNGDYRIRCATSQWANQHNVQQFPSPNDVGPKQDPGPVYLHRGRQHLVTIHKNTSPCTTMAPMKEPPMSAYLPDGTGTHVHFNVTNQGCWLNVPKCLNHTRAVGTYRDMIGERFFNASASEEMCFKRAATEWEYCGSNPREMVAAIYGPTGATSYGGVNCVIARYGCPKHGGPSDGQKYDYNNGTMFPDYYAINALNVNKNETACLQRAYANWAFCGSHRNHPVTAIYTPTGATMTAGAGCWIKMTKCSKHTNIKHLFYDAWGATNYLTDDLEITCLQQAEYYWNYCGYDPRYPVTATFRPTTKSFTFPS